MPELPPPVELIPADDEGDVTTVRNGADTARLHTWLRTTAIVAGAMSLAWVGLSIAGMRDAEDRFVCNTEVQAAMFGPFGPRDDDEFAARLVERAEECGLPLLADVLREDFDVDD